MINDPETPEVGVIPVDASTARWRVWASKARRVALVLDPLTKPERVAMEPEGRGFFSCVTAVPETGRRYAYSIDGGEPKPDPCSRWQPDGINAPSAVYYPERFEWDEGGWTGIDREDLVFYELHVGTFTPEGTFDAVMSRVEALRDLGVTAIELMPVAQFPGRWGWGYDGVHPFAPQNTYGGPEALQRLLAGCHRLGMAVTLDVVYNHFGPDGNMLPSFGDYFSDKYKTLWGSAINFDDRNCDPVRSMLQQNVRMWVRDYRFDALRFDATDQIYDLSPRHILSELAEVAHASAEAIGRRVYLFAESDLNDAPRFLHPHSKGGYGFDGHWNDDFHHAVHNVLTGEANGYYSDFAAGPRALAKALEEGFVNNGNYSYFRGRRHGTPAKEFTGDRLCAFTQNHDQVGNRLRSDRHDASVSPSASRLAAGLLLLAPRVPLLFMGQEYGETNPFPFFCDFQSPELVKAVRDGRKAEFAFFGWTEEIPDPVAQATRDSATLSWDWSGPRRSGLRRLYADLLRIRRESPALRDFRHARTRLHGDSLAPDVLEVVRGFGPADEPGMVTAIFNLSDQPQPIPSPFAGCRPSFRSESPEYGGVERTDADEPDALRPHEFVLFGPLTAP